MPLSTMKNKKFLSILISTALIIILFSCNEGSNSKNQTTQIRYTLSVNSGSGSGNYQSGATVEISANTAPTGQVFDSWVVDSGSPVIANATAASTTLTMGAGAATITATYKNTENIVYTLTVNSGSGSGDYQSGATVEISANIAPTGQVFDGWVVDSGSPVIANATAASTTLTMRAGAATITATYKNTTYWKPELSDTWQWQLNGTLNTSYDVKVYDVDLFDTPQSTINRLHNEGKRVICYFSAGTSENWRSDFSKFESSDMGENLSDWDGERWLDIRSVNVRNIMKARMDLAKSKGCDCVEPDNVDGFSNETGFPLTAEDQIDYNRFLSNLAHARNLAIGLKNDIAQLSDLVKDFDFAINEQCHEYDECDAYRIFINAGRAVFNAEYADEYRNNVNGARDALCRDSMRQNLRTLILPLDLDDSFRLSCDEENH